MMNVEKPRGNIMSNNIPNTRETVRLGEELYEREIRARDEPGHKGKMLALDINSGAYALGDDSMTAFDGLKKSHPDARIYILRVGFPTAVKLGAGRSVSQ